MVSVLGPPDRKRIVLIVGAIVLLGALVATAFVTVEIEGSTLVAVPDHRAGTRGTYVAFVGDRPVGALALMLDGPDAFAGPDGKTLRGYQIRANLTSGDADRHHSEWVTLEGVRVRSDVGDRRPGFEETRGAFRQGEPMVPDLDVVGDVLQPGAPVTSTGHRNWTWWTMKGSAPWLEQIGCDEASRSTGAGRLDGTPAVSVQTILLCGGHERVRTSWFTDETSLPQVVQFVGPGSGEPIILALDRYVAGTGAEIGAIGSLSGQPPTVRFGAAGATHPTTGDASSVPFPLEEAMQQVDSSAETGLFRLWSARNPDAELAGALLVRGEHHWRDRPTDQWRLLYGDEDAGYLVGVERARDGSQTWVTDHGDVPLDEGGDREAPPRLMTVASAGALWAQAAAEEYRGAPLDHFHWGLDVPFVWSEDCEFEPPRTALIPQEPGRTRFVVGHSTFGSCTDPKVVRAESYVVVDAEEGRLVEIVEHRVELERFPHGSVPRGATAGTISGPAPFSAAFPAIEPVAAVTVPLLIVLWTLYFWPLLKVGSIRLYARVLPSAAPDHPVRARIIEVVAADEGLSASELVARAAVGWGALTHHAALLEKGGFIRSCVVGRTRHFFTAETARGGSMEAMALLRHSASRDALEAIAARPGITQSQLAETLDMTPAGALWHVRRLHEAGLIGRERKGRYVTYYRTDVTGRPRE